MRDLKIALIQDEISWQDPPANRQRYQRHFDAICDSTSDVNLIVLPEMFSTGFYIQPRETFETMQGETVAWMRDNAKMCNAVITGSLIMELEGRFVNRMIWAPPDGEVTCYDKRHLFRFGGEHHYYHAGNKQVIVELAGWRVALFICYDLRFPVWSRNRGDYDVGIYVANWPNARQHAWESLLVARAIENQAYVIGVNRVGSNPIGDEFSGGSVILDFLGQPIESCDDRLTIARAALSIKALQDFREYFPAALDRDTFEIDC